MVATATIDDHQQADRLRLVDERDHLQGQGAVTEQPLANIILERLVRAHEVQDLPAKQRVPRACEVGRPELATQEPGAGPFRRARFVCDHGDRV